MLLRNIKNYLVCAILLSASPIKAETWTFDKVLKYAKENGPEVEIAKARVEAARAQLAQSQASLWPRLQFQSGYSQTDIPMYSFGNILNQRSFSPSIDFNNVPSTDNLLAKGVASYTLYSGGRNAAKREGSKANLEDSVYQKKVVENDYSTQVAINFLEIKKIAEVVKSMESAVKAFKANEKAVSGRFSAGTALKTELLDIQVQLEQVKEELVHVKNSKNLLVESLKSLLAVEDDNFELAQDDVALVEPVKLSSSPERTELKSIEAKKRLAEAQIKEATSGYLPRVSLQGGYDHYRGLRLDNNNGSNYYSVGVFGEWDIFDGFLTAERRREAKAMLNVVRQNEVRLKKSLALELSAAKIKLSEAKEAFAISEKAEKIAAESAKLTRLRFSQGLSTATQLIDAEHALTRASVRRAQASSNKSIATVLLRRALDLSPNNI